MITTVGIKIFTASILNYYEFFKIFAPLLLNKLNLTG
jgi:hypothetical protein